MVTMQSRRTRGSFLKRAAAGLAVLAMTAASAILAGVEGKEAANVPDKTWTLSTEDTRLTVIIENDRALITSLKNPRQGWDWIAKSNSVIVPLPSVASGNPVTWRYLNHRLETSGGTRLALNFVCASPKMELQSVWRARPGVGPVEHQITVVNRSGAPLVFQGDDIEAANLCLAADKPARFFPLDSGVVGFGEGTPLPYQIVDIGNTHGIYFAYDYGCGQYQATREANNPLQIRCRFWVGNKVSTTISEGESYRLPGILIQTYQGDKDDAANHFRKWFWNYEITPRLKNDPTEPPIEICNPPGPDGNPHFLVKQARKSAFAGWGVGCLKTDAWHGSRDHPRSDELGAALHANGIKLALYFNGQVPLKVLLDEAAKSHFDYYRSDDNGGGPPFLLRDYHSVEDFKRKVDKLAEIGVGWENCSNGGNLRSLDICRRMTFMTHSDGSGLVPFFVHLYHWSYMMPPIQIKNDYWVGEGNQEEGKVTVAWLRGNLLGAILTGPPTSRSFLNSLDQIKRIFYLYNTRQRAILRGADVYRILPPPAAGQWFGLQYHNTFIERGSVLVWQNGGPASKVIKLKGLERGATYALSFEDAGTRCSVTGAQLMDEGVEVIMGTNASEIVWINCPDLSVNPGELNFETASRTSQPAPIQLSIAYNRGPETNKAFLVNAADSWVKIKPITGAGNGQTFAVSVVPGDRPFGVYWSKVVVSRQDLPDRIEVPVCLRVTVPEFARWKLDEKDGVTAKDDWGNFTGTLVGGLVWEAGRRGGALRFNGKGQYVDTKWNLEGLDLPCTFAFWVNPADSQGGYADIFGNHEGASLGLVLQQNGTELNKYSFAYAATPAPGGAGPLQLTANEWQHVAIVCDGKDVIIYRNGKEVARGAGANQLTPNLGLNFRLASGHAGGRFFKGALGDFRIYARALSAAEVAGLAKETE